MPPPSARNRKPCARVERRQNRGMTQDAGDPEHRERAEPDQHDRPEDRPDSGGPAALRGEEQHQDRDRERNHEGPELRLHDGQPLERTQHRDRGRQHAVGVEQRRSEQSERDQQQARPAADLAVHQRHEREDPAFALVVGAQHVEMVLERDHDDERPEDERQRSQHVGAARLDAVRTEEALADGVERTRSDVAVDDSERRQRQRRDASRIRFLSVVVHRLFVLRGRLSHCSASRIHSRAPRRT